LAPKHFKLTTPLAGEKRYWIRNGVW